MFTCDYMEGCHPKILERLTETNLDQTIGYGEDEHCLNARRLILEALDANGCEVHFLVGGTQTNQTFIASALRPHEGVICAASGHINVHETGAIEATGHKVLALKADSSGKLTAAAVEAAYKAHIEDETHEHMVKPAMVYISHPTENGCLYSLSELKSLREVTRRLGLILYLDGARLGYGLSAPSSDVRLKDLPKLTDAFYIGGTKVGALFGEALVLCSDKLKPDFRYLIKQRGGLLSKGRLLGIQFEVLFTDGLYLDIAKRAVDEALRIAEALKRNGYELFCPPETNQIFPILSDRQYSLLVPRYGLELWATLADGRRAVRICTSWATTRKQTDAIIKDIELAAE